MANKNILILVEGEKTDVVVMQSLFKLYDLDTEFKIISYKTNIYTLYKKMFETNESEYLDLIQTLKEHDPKSSNILNEKFSDILLVFDLDPQDSQFSERKIMRMIKYFNESTENGKLYLNYPMIEALNHVKVPDYGSFLSRQISADNIKNYKSLVHSFTADPGKNLTSKEVMNNLIYFNHKKIQAILDNDIKVFENDMVSLAKHQLEKLKNERTLFVICTCILFVLHYNPKLVISGLLE